MRKFRAAIILALVVTTASIGPQARAVTLPEETEIDLTQSPRPAGTVVGGQTVIAVRPLPPEGSPQERELAASPQIKCSLDNDGSFVGDRTGTGLRVDFKYVASTVCSDQIIELDVQATMKQNGNTKDSTHHATCRACVQVNTGVTDYFCSSSCHGVWRVESVHVFAMPAGFILIDYDAGRCQMSGGAYMTCVVRSNKVRL